MQQRVEAVVLFGSGEVGAQWGQVVLPTRPAFMCDQMTQHLDDFGCSAK